MSVVYRLLLIIFIVHSCCQCSSALSEVYIDSHEKRGYDVYVDGTYIGTEGTGVDVLDGKYTVNVTGNNKHSIFADDGIYKYGLQDFFFADEVPYLFGVGDPLLRLGPSISSVGSNNTSVFGKASQSQTNKDVF
jgi:hypothetical protein